MFSKNNTAIVASIFVLFGLFVVFQGCKDDNDVQPKSSNSYLKADIDGNAWHSNEAGALVTVLAYEGDTSTGIVVFATKAKGEDTALFDLTILFDGVSSIQEITDKTFSLYVNGTDVEGKPVGGLIYTENYSDTAAYMATAAADIDGSVAGTVTFHYSVEDDHRMLSGEFQGEIGTYPTYPSQTASITKGTFKIDLDNTVSQERIKEILKKIPLD